MAMQLRPRFVPKCSACIQRWTDARLPDRRPFAHIQTREAHKTANASPIPNTIPVMLLKAVHTYGKQGAIVPVPVSYMRNKLYPQKQARYIVGEEAKQLKDRPQVIARDPDFDARPHLQKAAAKELRRIKREQFFAPENAENIKIYRDKRKKMAEEKKARRAEAKAAELKQSPSTEGAAAAIDTLKPNRSMGLLQSFLPASLEFERPINVQSEHSQGGLPVYGSVSIDDVTERVRSLVSHNDEAARINFSALNIEFVNLPEGEDQKRVKHIGTHRIDISLNGTDRRVSRQVSVVQEPPRTARTLKQAEGKKLDEA